jgi:hypothetical protein
MAGEIPKQNLGRTTVWRRAQELKRELLRPTTKLPEHRASSYEQNMWVSRSNYSPRRRSVFLPFCIALLLGALSMTLPVSGTFTLQGTLSANSEPEPAADTDTASQHLPEGTAGRAVVFAEPAECPWVLLDEPSIVTIDVPGQSDLVMSAAILSIAAHARDENANPKAADAQPPCRVELALLPEGDEGNVLRTLPLGAATRADFPTTRNWIGAFMAQLPSDSRQAVEKASAGLRTLAGWTRELYRTYVAPRLHQAASGLSGSSNAAPAPANP